MRVKQCVPKGEKTASQEPCSSVLIIGVDFGSSHSGRVEYALDVGMRRDC